MVGDVNGRAPLVFDRMQFAVHRLFKASGLRCLFFILLMRWPGMIVINVFVYSYDSALGAVSRPAFFLDFICIFWVNAESFSHFVSRHVSDFIGKIRKQVSFASASRFVIMRLDFS